MKKAKKPANSSSEAIRSRYRSRSLVSRLSSGATLDDRHGMAVRGYVWGINWRNVQRLVNSTSLSGALHF